LQQIEGSPSDQAEIGCAVIFSGAMGIFAELHVQYPVLLILDRPMTANGERDAGSVGD
jgi:hypothetical protein